jgi:hypothetical protein
MARWAAAFRGASLNLIQSCATRNFEREPATRLRKLSAEVMETQFWRPNVGIAELGKDNP